MTIEDWGPQERDAWKEPWPLHHVHRREERDDVGVDFAAHDFIEVEGNDMRNVLDGLSITDAFMFVFTYVYVCMYVGIY